MTVNSLSIFGGDRTIQRNTFTDTDRLPALRIRALIPDMLIQNTLTNLAGVYGNLSSADYHAASGQYIATLAGAGLGIGGQTVGATNYVYTSTDARTWTQRTTPSAVNAPTVKRIGSNWVVVGNSACHTSPDGITWTSRTAPWAVNGVRSITYNSTIGVGVCVNASSIYYSTDNGQTWTASTAPANMGTPKMVCAFKGLIIMACSTGTASGLYYTTNGSSWTACTIKDHLNGTLTFSDNNTSCFAVEGNSTTAVALSNSMVMYAATSSVVSLTSSDGITFTVQTTITADFNFNPLYRVSEVSSQVYTGPAISVMPRAGTAGTAIANDYFRVINGKFVLLAIVDTRCALFLSNDGINWTTLQPFALASSYDDTVTAAVRMSVVKDQLVLPVINLASSGITSQWFATNPNAKELVYVL